MEGFLRWALELAGSHRPHPNPRVGAIVFDRTGQVAAVGAHDGPGTPHAERIALDRAGSRAVGGTLLVTLEPCTHHGMTPPCTDAVVGSGIERVLVGAIDPDPRVSGGGIRALREAGIAVVGPIAQLEVEACDPGYFHHRRTGRPRLTLKVAATADGQTAAADGSSRWITGPEAREDGHRLRREADAVLIGAGTLRADDPLLTARIADGDDHQPVPVIVAGGHPLPGTARIWDRDPIVISPIGAGARGGRSVEVPSEGDRVDLTAALGALGARGLLEVLCEGGATLAAGLMTAGLVDRVVVYIAPTMSAGLGRPIFDGTFSTLGDAITGEFVSVRSVGPDLRVEWRPSRST